MEEFVCVTTRSRPQESVAEYSRRLTEFWTGVLRCQPAEYLRVYAEASQFAGDRGCVTRQYMIGADVADTITNLLAAAGIDHDPIDPDDLYSKYEATPPDWFQIPH